MDIETIEDRSASGIKLEFAVELKNMISAVPCEYFVFKTYFIKFILLKSTRMKNVACFVLDGKFV